MNKKIKKIAKSVQLPPVIKKRKKNNKLVTLASVGIGLVVIGALAGGNDAKEEVIPEEPVVEVVKEIAEEPNDIPIILEESQEPLAVVHFIDVGQGDCTLIESAGQYMMIDAGPDESGTKIQKYLQDREIKKIDYLILTHPDSDHIGGADVVIMKFDIGKIFMSSFVKDNSYYSQLQEAINYKEMGFEIPKAGNTFDFGDCSVTFLQAKIYDDPNNSSLCFKVSTGDKSIFFGGDMERQAEIDLVDSGKDLSATIYHVSHHGSYTSSSKELLNAINPEYAVVSCKVDNEYGHPHKETVDELRERGISLFRTDIQGTVTAKISSESIEWSLAPDQDYIGGDSELEKKYKEKELTADLENSATDAKEVSAKEANDRDVAAKEASVKVESIDDGSKKDDLAAIGAGAVAGAVVGNEATSKNNKESSTAKESVQTNDVPASQDYVYIGNVNNMKLHQSNCTGKLPKESNRVYFHTLEEAEKAGYTKENQCKNCKPYGN